jgi:hypothetical protein
MRDGAVRSMRIAIQLNHELSVMTCNVRDIAADLHLLAKMIAAGAERIKQAPHPALGGGGVIAELLGSGRQLRDPLPNPPRKGEGASWCCLPGQRSQTQSDTLPLAGRVGEGVFWEAHSHRFMPVVAMPSMRRRWKNRKIRKIGTSDRIDMANRPPQSEAAVESTKVLSPSVTV